MLQYRPYHYQLGLLLLLLLEKHTVILATTSSSTNNTTTRHDSALYNRLRGYYALQQQQTPLHVERIIDKGAIAQLTEKGVDPSSDQFVYHPPGHEANHNAYPFFGHWSHAMCGVSIVHDDIVLTAAHCGRKAMEPHWRKSMRFLSKFRKEGGITRAVAHMEPHPDFFQPQQIYDFQLVKIQASALVATKHDDNKQVGAPTGAQIVKLNYDSNKPKPADEVQAVGFGTVTPDGSTGNSRVLMDVTLQAFSNEHCERQYGGQKIKGDVMICIGSLDGSKDTCQGDSGGPMLDIHNVQVGVVSWGEGCAEADHAGLASRVSAVTDWIEREICRLSAMPPKTCIERNMPTTCFDKRLPSGDSEDDKGTFQMRVTVQHDHSPKETSWSVTHIESATLLYFQPFESVPEPFVDVSHVFHNLVAGTYNFAISDTEKDGLCCEFGQGSIVITNHGTEQVLWEHNGKFEEFLGVTIKLDEAGNVVSLEEATEWINPSVRVSKANEDKLANANGDATPGNNEKLDG
ncbi:Plasminogen (Fragment) [Seminavis robusta]|uniref:Plasminogen n=1 Tax=Seminavis robusta TaxID=568900 RepID=A0A9N8EIQ4_9STRA